jgi:hypothetical protein
MGAQAISTFIDRLFYRESSLDLDQDPNVASSDGSGAPSADPNSITSFAPAISGPVDAVDWYEQLVSTVAVHTSFDSLSSDSLSRLRNEVIKQARAMSVYDQLSADVLIHVIIDVIRTRIEHADILGQVFVNTRWQNKLLKTHDISHGLFGNRGLGFTDYVRYLLTYMGKPAVFQLPHFQ